MFGFEKTRFGFVWIALVALFAHEASAQRDPPVWHCYLSPIEVVPDRTDVTVKFTLHHGGGPHEHVERQCYLLLYRKAQEQAILRAVGERDFVSKEAQDERPFLRSLEDEGLLHVEESRVAMIEASSVGRGFSFQFGLKGGQLLKAAQRLKGYSSAKASVAGKWSWHDDALGLIAFVPVNDSVYATKVSGELQKMYDFARVMDTDTSVLMFKPLPYNLTLRESKTEVTVHVH
ncbi:MAG: hypothetical protein AAFU85_01920 [Planctomycetota bacterium]